MLGRDAARLATQVEALGGAARAQAVGVDVTDEAVIRCLYDMPVLSPSGARDWRVSGDLDECLAART